MEPSERVTKIRQFICVIFCVTQSSEDFESNTLEIEQNYI